MVDAEENAVPAEIDAVFDAPDYKALRERARELGDRPDPVPELGRQGSNGSGNDDATGGGSNSYALRLLQAKPAAAPDLSRFPAAIDVDAAGVRTFAALAGDVVVVNVFASRDVLAHRPYLKTVKGIVTRVDAETGVVSLYDVDRQQATCCSFLTIEPEHLRWPGRRLREAQGDLTEKAEALLASGSADDAAEALQLLMRAKGLAGRAESAGTNVVAKRKVGRPRRQRTPEELERQRLHEERKARGEVKRGRPKGTKNRPKDVVDAEKLRVAKERRDRRGQRIKRAA